MGSVLGVLSMKMPSRRLLFPAVFAALASFATPVAAQTNTITIAAGTSPVTEGSSAGFTVSVSDTTAGATVNVTVSEASGSDFVASGDEGSKTVTVNPGSTFVIYWVPTQDDTTDEPNGSVTVTLASGTGYAVGAASSASVTVNDDDDPPATNNAPVFTSQDTTASVVENSGDGTDVVTITATDSDAGDTITYSLDATSDKVFDIDSNGAITVQVESGSALNHEGTSSYAATVTATDSSNATATHGVTISVTDEDEPPDAPGAPTVTGASSTSVSVSWTAPTNAGRPDISDYDVRYFKGSADPANEADWIEPGEAGGHDHSGAGTSTTITGLDASSAYRVQVMATNAEGDGAWSATGSGATKANNAPVFTSQDTTASVVENSGDGTDVVTITATDSDAGDTITYSLDATSDKVFDIDSNGAITVQVESGSALNHEGTSSYAATVTATDSSNATATHGVTISVTDEDEPPDAPGAPTVTGASSTSVSVSWTAPTNAGRPDISDYDVRYFKGSADPANEADWIEPGEAGGHDHSGAGTSTTITGLDASSAYRVQVMATNAEGDSAWSATGSGTTKNPPVFTDQATTASVAENSGGGTEVVTITATDADGDTITYSLDSTSDAVFDIGGSSGAITVQSGADLNHEGTPSYAATVTATDSNSDTATHDVTISVTDVLEPPDAPAAPTVTAASTSSVDVSWTAPDVTGKPAITDYDVRYRRSDNSAWLNHDFTGTGTQTTIPDLHSAGFTYDVQVKARNAEGASGWSATGSTAILDMIVTISGGPAVTEGTAATFTVTADRAMSANILVSIRVSEAAGSDFVAPADEGTHGVTIAADTTTATHSVPTQNDSTDEPHGAVTVLVAASTGYNVGTPSSASVTVNDDDDPPNRAPVFTDQATTASVAENSGGGTEVVTITATDADGDTITYSLDSTSDAVFDIGGSSGAITVQSGADLNHEGTPSYAATVTATDSNSDTATHDVTISVTDEDEPPDAPAAPAVTGASNTSVTVTWTAPANTGRPAITDYDVQFRASGATGWTGHGFTGAGTSTTIPGLTAGTTYEAQVQATNAEGTSGWSASGRGATDSPTNSAPAFTNQPSTASVAENSVGGTPVATIAATDADGDTLSYSLDLTSDAVFDIGSSGAITVGSGAALDYEATPSYAVVVTVSDGTVDVSHSLTINVSDENEPPDAPEAPTVTGASSTSVTVSWTASDTTGRPAITDYDVQYRAAGDADWTDASYDGTTTNTTISSLSPGTTYDVRVQATNAEGTGPWSATGSGATSATSAPVFSDQATTASVDENSADGTAVVTITATGADGDTITYSLDGASDAVFDIGSSSGAITVQVDAGSALDHEGTPSFTATVTATDSNNATATHEVTIDVTDVDEPPDSPEAPTVTGASATSVDVRWTAPDNTGRPAITDYDVQYRAAGDADWTDAGYDGVTTATTIASLTADVTYDVQVKAKNDEGASGWSATGTGSPNHNPPKLDGSRVSGSTVTLEFDRNLDATSVPDPQDFTVTATGGDAALAVSFLTPGAAPVPRSVQQEEHRVTAVSIQGSVLTLTVSPPVRVDQGVTVSYTRGVRPLRTEDGAVVADFTVGPPNETPANRAPTADAGEDLTTASGAVVTLDGSASADPDGDALTFSWTQTAGVVVTLEGADTAQASFAAPSQPGALSFRLTVADPGGFTAEDTVTVTVRDATPDFGNVEVAELSLNQGQAIEPLVLPAASGGNGALSYSLTSLPAGLAGLAFDPSTRTLSGTPPATGSFVFTYRAEDADANRTDADAASLTFQVTVSTTADRKRMLTHALGGMGQQLLSNAQDNIGARFGNLAAGNRATVAGRSLASLDLSANGLESVTGRMAWARPESPATVNRELIQAGAFGGGSASACATGELDPRAFAYGVAASCGLGASHGAPPGARLLRNSDFSWLLGAASGGSPQGPRWSLWGRGDLGMFEGRPDSDSGYDGEARAGWLGVDTRAGPWVAGLAVSRGTSEADYHFGSSAASAQNGRLEIELTALYPYVRWAFANGLELQGVLGTGSGDARHLPGRGAPEDAGLKMRLGSLGMRAPMPALVGLEMNARADVGFVWMETGDGAEAVHGLRADTWRARFGLEASRRIVWGPGCELAPFVEAAGRRDSGDGLEGTGVEVAGGVRYRDRRFQLEARGRALVMHSADGADERGVSLSARLVPRANGGGLSLALTPRWGTATGPAESLWRHQMPRLARNAGPETALLDAQVGYGFFLSGGLLTPFAEANLTGADNRVLRMGVRFEATGINLQTELLAERYEYTNARTDHGLRLNLRIGY